MENKLFEELVEAREKEGDSELVVGREREACRLLDRGIVTLREVSLPGVGEAKIWIRSSGTCGENPFAVS